MDKKFDFGYFFNLFVKNWLLILLTALIFGSAALVVCHYILTPRYTSSVSLYIGRVDEASRGGQTMQSDETARARSLYNDLLIGTQLVQDYREMLNSRRIRDKVAAKLRIIYPLGDLNYKIDIFSPRNTRFLVISATAADPAMTALMANSTAEVFIDEADSILGVGNAQIIDRAGGDGLKVFPMTNKFVLLGFLAGGLLAYLTMLVIGLLDTTFHTPETVVDSLQLPILGTIPEDEMLTEESGGAVQRNRSQIVSAGSPDHRQWNTTEAFRSLRTGIRYLDVSPLNGARVIALTSTLPGEGKTFCAANLAAALADAGMRTLLLNCDLRRPALQKAFDINPEYGLVNILADNVPFEQSVVKGLLDLPLDVLVCGPIPPNPSRLLVSEKFRTLLEGKRRDYDYIILDAPPCLNLADAAIVGGFSDGIILVVRANHTKCEIARRALDQLRQMNQNVMGVILNRFSVQIAEKSYGYYSYGYHNYGGENESPEPDLHGRSGGVSKLRQYWSTLHKKR